MQSPTTFSPDGYWWWDGAGWKPALSSDGSWRWTGRAWVAAGAAQPTRRGLSTGALVGLVASVTAIVLVVVAVMSYVAVSRFNTPTPAATQTPASGQSASTAIPCDQLEHTQVHYHAAVQILYQGRIVAIPTAVGRSSFCYYWLHRAGHEVAVFWAAHVVHHQSQDYNLSTALRQTSSGALLGWIFYMPMAVAGVPTPLADAMKRHAVVVLALVSPRSTVDNLTLAEAKAGATAAHAGFATVDVANNAQVQALSALVSSSADPQNRLLDAPAVLIFQRPRTLYIRVNGYVDADTVEQAVVNAAPLSTTR